MLSLLFDLVLIFCPPQDFYSCLANQSINNRKSIIVFQIKPLTFQFSPGAPPTSATGTCAWPHRARLPSSKARSRALLRLARWLSGKVWGAGASVFNKVLSPWLFKSVCKKLLWDVEQRLSPRQLTEGPSRVKSKFFLLSLEANCLFWDPVHSCVCFGVSFFWLRDCLKHCTH